MSVRDCRDFEILLDDFIQGLLNHERRPPLEDHLSHCARCRDLETIARASLRGPVPESAATLAASVLARTSGPTCAGAHERLVDFVDHTLEPTDAVLVEHHLNHCHDCETIARTLRWLGEDLPVMAEIRPDEAFLQEVLARTVRSPRRITNWFHSVRRTLAHLGTRPRLASEAAYIMTMVLWLLFASPVAPWPGLPARAMGLARTDTAPLMQAAMVPMVHLTENATAASRWIWTATAQRGVKRVHAIQQGWTPRSARLGGITRSLAGHGASMTLEALRGNFQLSRIHLKRMGSDLKVLWHVIVTPEPDDDHHSKEA